MTPAVPLRLAALVPPRLPRGCLLREDLVREVGEALGGDVVEFVAGAGFGKTTLLLQALERVGMPVAWVSCDSSLADPGMLFSAIKQSFARVAPGFAATSSCAARLRLFWERVAAAGRPWSADRRTQVPPVSRMVSGSPYPRDQPGG